MSLIPPPPNVPVGLAHILDLWLIDDDFARVMPALKAYVAPRCGMTLDPDEIDITAINAPNGDRAKHVPLLYCDSANEHVDLSHPEWTAILVVQASSHKLGLADYRPAKSVECCDYGDDRARAEIPLRAGQVMVLNDHHTHWLTPAADGSRFIGIALEYDLRPSRESVEAALRAILAAHGFPMTADALA